MLMQVSFNGLKNGLQPAQVFLLNNLIINYHVPLLLFRKWPCLMNPPPGRGEHILNTPLHTSFSLDEQCRIEFGDG